MAGSRKKRELSSDFWCINCGNKGIPIMRERGSIRAQGHRKALYCIHCRMTINHIETRNVEEAQQFREDFDAGLYKEEAKESIAFDKQRNKT